MKKTTTKLKTLCALALSVMITGQSFAGIVPKAFIGTEVQSATAQKFAASLLAGRLGKYELYQLNSSSFSSALQARGYSDEPVTLQLGSHSWALNLNENSNVENTYILRGLTENGIQEYTPTSGIHTYAGYSNGNVDHHTRLTIKDEYMAGIVKDESGLYIIEPLSRYSSDAPSDQFIVYRPEDELAEPLPCGVKGEVSTETSFAKANRIANNYALPACFTVDIAVALDYMAYSIKLKSDKVKAELEVISIFNLINEIYKGLESSPNPVTINFRVVEIFVEETDANTFKSSKTLGQSSGMVMLDAFNKWAPNGFKKSYGLGSLFTARGADGDIAGWSINGLVAGNTPPPNTVCNPLVANYDLAPHNVNKFGYFGNWGTAIITAHEMGHNFACAHNGPAGGPNLMTNGPMPSSFGWSSTEYNSISGVVNLLSSKPSCFQPCNNVAPIANFITYNGGSSTGTSCSGYVCFVNRSTGATAWEWDFGDGSLKSTERNPIYKYSKTGVFTISLKAMSGNQTVTKTSTIAVNNISNALATNTVGLRNVAGDFSLDAGNLGNPGILFFNVFKPTLLKTLKLKPNKTGFTTIEIRDGYMNTVFTKTVSVTANVDNLILLNAELPVGTGFSIGVGKSTDGLLLMNANSTVPLNYPFNNSGTPALISITESNFGILKDVTQKFNWYYYFYNLEVQGLTCNADPTVGINENNLNTNFTIYPNPISGNQLNIEFTQALKQANIEILNVLGQVVLSKSLQTVQVGVNTVTLPSDLAKGTYIFKINSENGTHAQKLIIE